MLGKRDPQRGLFGATSLLDLDRLGFYGKLATEGHRIFRDTDFARCYSKIGRPSAAPSLCALARLLQHYEGISDDQVIERLKYDLRWKAALDQDPLAPVSPFAKSTFQAFRVRLTLHAKEGLAFEKSVRLAKKAGLLPKKLCVALDSSPVRGRGAVKDTFNLLSDAIRSVVRELAGKQDREVEETAAKVGVERHFQAASIKGSEIVDWPDESEKTAFLAGLLDDCDKVVAAAKKAKCASEQVKLLEKIVDQDIDRTGDDGPAIRKGVAKDRTISVSDPEMRHGHKSNGKVYNGHKAHLAVDVASGIITAVDVTAPAVSDGALVKDLLKETARLTRLPIKTALGDSAYSTRLANSQAEEAEVELRTKMPSPPRWRFGPGEFKVSRDHMTARCPAGHLSVKRSRAKEKVLHKWSPELCGDCPLKARCTKAEKRQLLVEPDFHQRRRKEREAKSPRGRALLKKRIEAEHAFGRTKNRGAGRARCSGRKKTKAQWQWTAAVENLIRILAEPARARRRRAA